MSGSTNPNLLAALRSRVADDRAIVSAFVLSATGECKSAVVELVNGVLIINVEGGQTVQRITWNFADPKYSTVGRLLAELQKARGYTVLPDQNCVIDHPSSDLVIAGMPDISNKGSATFRHRIWSDTELMSFLHQAATLHNPNYSGINVVPRTEHPYVLMRAAALAYRVLAADTVRRRHLDADSDRLINLAKDLEQQYQTDTRSMHRVIPSPKADESKMGTGDVVVGTLVRESLRTGLQGPVRNALPPTAPRLYDAQDDDVEDTTIRLRWSQDRDDSHSHYEVWRDTGPRVERSLAGRLSDAFTMSLPAQSQVSRAGTAKQVLGAGLAASPIYDGFFFWTASEANATSLVNSTFIDGQLENNVGPVGASALGEPLEPETDYYYRIYVVNKNGEYAFSEVKRYRTKALRARLKRSSGLVASDALSVLFGAYTGGEALAIKGTHFVEGMRVLLNGKPCTSVTIVDSENLTCVTPVFTNPDWVGKRVDIVLESPTGLLDIYSNAWLFA